MAINQDDFFQSVAEDLFKLNTLPETEEEKKKREEEERLKVLQRQESIEKEPVEVTEKKTSEIKMPQSKSEEEFFQNLSTDLKTESEKDIDYTTLDGISTTRRVQFGAAQEPAILGSTYRLLKAGVQAAFTEETFNEAARRIEGDRQKKIFEEFPEFQGKKEDLTVLSGRMGVAIADPVTFFIPWTKIAKAGKLASTAVGAGVASTDVALRDYALTGEINTGNVAIGALLGGASTGIGELIARKINAAPKTEKLITLDSDGKAVTTTLKNTDPVFIGPLPEQTQKALMEVSEDAFVISQPYINRFQDNINTLGVKFQERDLIRTEIQKIKTRLAQSKTYQDLPEVEKMPGFAGMPPKRTLKEKELIDDYKRMQDANKELVTLQKEIDELTLIKQPENIAIVGLNSLKKAYDKGLLKGTMGENLTRALVHETFRPLFGATAGGLVGLTLSDGETDDALNAGMIAGATLGLLNKRLENYDFAIKTKKIVVEESEKIFRNSFRTVAKKLLAGTHSAKLQAGSPVIRDFGEDMFLIQGASTETGKVLKESVEELSLKTQDYYRKALYDITNDLDDETLLAAGRLVQQHNMPKDAKYSFLEAGDLENKEAITAASKLLGLNNSFKGYVRETGLVFKDEDAYGLTQILDQGRIRELGRDDTLDILKESFRIQNVNQRKLDDTIELLSDEQLLQRAKYYLDNSDNIRRQEIVTTEKLQEKVINLVKNDGKPLKENDTLIQAARFFDNERTLFDQEARAFAKQLFVQDPEFTNIRLFENTIPVTEFSRRFGAKGQGLEDVINNLKKYYGQFDDIESNMSLKKLLKDDVKTLSDSVNAYFKVYGMSHFGSQSDGWRSALLTMQVLLSTTKLIKVALPSLGDLVQVMQNSGFKPAYNSFVRQFADQGSKATKPSASLALRSGRIKEGFFGRQTFKGKRYNGTLERELSDLNMSTNTQYQKNLVEYQQRFFEIVQLGRITRFAREFAFDAGAFRAFDLGKKSVAGKIKPSQMREINTNLGLTLENIKYLGKFKTMDDAYADKMGKILIERAGRKAADRDALIPTVGNRRLFSQSNNPFIKFMGSFLSWAQAKSSQTNALLRRIEDGDGKLAVMMLASMPIYATIRQMQIGLNPNEEFRKDYGNPFEDEESFKKFLGDTAVFSGQLMPFYLDKIISGFRYNKDNAIENLYPVVALLNDFVGGLYDVTLGDKPYTGPTRIVETIVPAVKEVTRRRAVGEALGLDESIYETVKLKEKDVRPLPKYATGGIVTGPEVPFTKEDPANRVDPFTGEPYQEQMDRLGFGNEQGTL